MMISITEQAGSSYAPPLSDEEIDQRTGALIRNGNYRLDLVTIEGNLPINRRFGSSEVALKYLILASTYDRRYRRNTVLSGE